MGLLDQLWDDTVAGPRPESGLGKLRKHSTFSGRSSSGEVGSKLDGGSARSYGNDSSESGLGITPSIMIVRSPGYQNGSPPISPVGSSSPASPFSGRESFRLRRRSASDAFEKATQGGSGSPSPHNIIQMEEVQFDHDSKEKIFKIFKEFMVSVAKIEKLGTLGRQLLSGFQQGLELLHRPAINRVSKLIENVIEANDTENLRLYFEAGCINTHDGVQSTNKSRSLIDELGRLLNDVNIALENRPFASTVSDEDVESNEEQATLSDKKPDANEYALWMGIINLMFKKDYTMQMQIISDLSLKSSTGELETYCLMWSLRPYIDDEIMRGVWKLVP